MTKKKETVGKLAVGLAQKQPDSRDPIEIERELHKDYEKNIFEAIDRGKKEIIGDFFIGVVTKREPLLQNVLRNYFYYRSTCPTPDYDQTVYHYHAKEDRLEFLWVIPCREACFAFKDNVLKVPEEEKDLLRFILDFDDGTLYKLCKKLNGEEDVSPFLVK